MLKHEFKSIENTVVTANSNATVTATFDTVGFSRAVIELNHGASAVTTVPAVLKLSEGDTTSAYTDIDAFTAGTGFTAASPSTSAGTNIYRFDVDLRGRKRHLKLTFTAAAGQGTTVITTHAKAMLFRAALGTDTVTKLGVTQVVSG